MPWLAQPGDGRYYYRSVRAGDRVRKVYIGRGEEAERAAREDEERRQQKERSCRALQDEVQAARAAQEATESLQSAVEAWFRAVLIANGFHSHKGEWRRRRNVRHRCDRGRG